MLALKNISSQPDGPESESVCCQAVVIKIHQTEIGLPSKTTCKSEKSSQQLIRLSSDRS